MDLSSLKNFGTKTSKYFQKSMICEVFGDASTWHLLSKNLPGMAQRAEWSLGS